MPGIAGTDYPVFSSNILPITGFSCSGGQKSAERQYHIYKISFNGNISYLQNILMRISNLQNWNVNPVLCHCIVSLPGQPYLPGIYVDQKTGCQVENRILISFSTLQMHSGFLHVRVGWKANWVSLSERNNFQPEVLCLWLVVLIFLVLLVSDMFPPFRYNIDCDRQADYLQMNKFLYPEGEGKYNIPCCSAILVNVV